MIDFVLKLELCESSCGVSTAHDGKGFGVGHRLRHGVSPRRKASIFEHAHRSVPEHHAGVHNDVGESGRRAGPDVVTDAALTQPTPKLSEVALSV